MSKLHQHYTMPTCARDAIHRRQARKFTRTELETLRRMARAFQDRLMAKEGG